METMLKRKIIFLDVDLDASKEFVESLNIILTKTFARIVIISNWSQKFTLKQIHEIFWKKGLLEMSIIDKINLVYEPNYVIDDDFFYFETNKDKFIVKYIIDNMVEKSIIIEDNPLGSHSTFCVTVNNNSKIEIEKFIQIVEILNQKVVFQ